MYHPDTFKEAPGIQLKKLEDRFKQISDANERLDKWISDIRGIMENKSRNTTEFLDEFKNNLYSDEIYVFTPKGDLFPLPLKSTALDFAVFES